MRRRAAASSIARGSPSSRRAISATSAAFEAVSSKSGRTRLARCTSNSTAGESPDRLPRQLVVGVGEVEGEQRELLLPPKVQGLTTRDQHRHVARDGEDLRDLGRGRHHVLEVVDDEDARGLGEHGADRVDERAVTGVTHAEGTGDRGQHEIGRTESGQIHEAHASSHLVAQDLGQLDREPRLAAAAGPGDRHQAHVVAVEQVEQRLHLEVAADHAPTADGVVRRAPASRWTATRPRGPRRSRTVR